MSGTSGYDGFRAVGSRLSEAQLPHLGTHRTELLGDSLPFIHAFDKAHLVMLAEQSLITDAQARALLTAMRAMEEEGIVAARDRAGGGMHSAEHYLAAELGIDLGGRISMGRSSGDLIEVARRLTVRHHLGSVIPGVHALRRTLLDLAGEHLDTVMPGYTHGQHAQPTTLAHWALMFERALSRDSDRLVSLLDRLNLSPAGAAIMTGSDFALDRHRTAELLGFERPLENTFDAIMSHDLEMEIAATYAIAAATLTRLADDLFLWATAEFAFIELPDRFCGTSSIMPQKKNPDALEAVKSVGGQALGHLVAIVTAERGPTGFPILERRQTQDALWATGRSLTSKLGDLSAIVRDMRVETARMARSAGAHWAQVTDVASAIVAASGMDWRSAHQVVGAFVRMSIDAGAAPDAATLETLDEASRTITGKPSGLDPAGFAEAMSARAFVGRRTIYGGPAPSAVERERAQLLDRLSAAEDRERERAARIEAAAADLEAAIDTIIAG